MPKWDQLRRSTPGTEALHSTVNTLYVLKVERDKKDCIRKKNNYLLCGATARVPRGTGGKQNDDFGKLRSFEKVANCIDGNDDYDYDDDKNDDDDDKDYDDDDDKDYVIDVDERVALGSTGLRPFLGAQTFITTKINVSSRNSQSLLHTTRKSACITPVF